MAKTAEFIARIAVVNEQRLRRVISDEVSKELSTYFARPTDPQTLSAARDRIEAARIEEGARPLTPYSSGKHDGLALALELLK